MQAELAGAAASSGALRTRVEITPPGKWSSPDLREVWGARELLGYLIWRDIRVRYKQTVLGAGWAVLQPLATVIVFSIIFGSVAKIPSGETAYPVFVFAGLLPWLFFAAAVNQGANALINQAHLVTKVYFPRLLLPLSCVGVTSIDFLIGFGLFLGMLLLYGEPLLLSVLWMPLLVGLLMLLAFGTAALLSGLGVIYRDVRFITPMLLQFWLYVTPVIYPADLVPEAYRWLLLLNPLTGIITSFRSVLLGTPLDGIALLSSVVGTGLMVWVGITVFHRHERRFADIA